MHKYIYIYITPASTPNSRLLVPISCLLVGDHLLFVDYWLLFNTIQLPCRQAPPQCLGMMDSLVDAFMDSAVHFGSSQATPCQDGGRTLAPPSW